MALMGTHGRTRSVERREFLRRTLQAAATTQLGRAAACAGPQTGGAGGGRSVVRWHAALERGHPRYADASFRTGSHFSPLIRAREPVCFHRHRKRATKPSENSLRTPTVELNQKTDWRDDNNTGLCSSGKT